MAYQCPKCERYGMQWDARAKVLTCYYNTCRHVIRMAKQKTIPSSERISAAIERNFQELHKRTPDQPVYVH